MRISKGAKRRAIKQQMYNMLKQEGGGYYFGDARFQREKLKQQVDVINLKNTPVVMELAPVVLKMMRKVAAFYGLKNRYPNAQTKAKEV